MMPLSRPRSDGEATDHVDRLSDDHLLHILNNISSQDIKSLGRCFAVSRRFRRVVPLVPSLLIHADCILFGDPAPSALLPVLFIYNSPDFYIYNAPLCLLIMTVNSYLTCSAVSDLLLFLHPNGFNSSPSISAVPSSTPSSSPSVVHRTPVHVIKNFSNLRTLRVVFPSWEVRLSDSTLLRWHAHFGSSLNRCLILAAAATSPVTGSASAVVADKDIIIPGPLRSRLARAWTLSCLTAATQRHSNLGPRIAERESLESLVATDTDGQGVLLMDRGELEELRKKPSPNKLPAIRMWEWFAPVVELSCGLVLTGATLIAARPNSGGEEEEEEEEEGGGIGLD